MCAFYACSAHELVEAIASTLSWAELNLLHLPADGIRKTVNHMFVIL
jgi:hypothetical protein